MDKKKILIICAAALTIIIAIIIVFIVTNKKIVTYNVVFQTDGGTIVSSQTINEGEKVKRPVDPKKEGYLFVEWTYQGKTYDFSLGVTKDLTLKAKWVKEKEDIETFIVKFDSDGGTTISNQIIEKGKKVIKPSDPKKEGYIFKEWTLNNEAYDFDKVIEEDIELKAKWEKENNNTGSNNNTGNNNNNTGNNSNNNNNNSGNTNNNNSNNAGNGGASNNNGGTTPAPVSKKYTVTFNSNGGSNVDSQTVTEGSKASKPNNPTRDGYTFVEWTLNNKPYDFNMQVSSNITLIAKWKENSTGNEILFKAPVLTSNLVGYDNQKNNFVYDIAIDYSSYRKDGKSYISGWELYVTSEDNPGNEMYIGGIGYWYLGSAGNEGVQEAQVPASKTYKYIARVYIEENGKKIYSDWSSILTVRKDLTAPVLSSEKVGEENNNVIYDVAIDYSSYRISPYIPSTNYISGWELYVTSDENPGNEEYIDNVGYFFHSSVGNETINPVYIPIGETYKYRARVFIKIGDEKVYSPWSKQITLQGR